MDAIQLGPLVLGWDRFAAILSVLVFVVAVEIIARMARQPALSAWAGQVVLWGFIGARLGHVVQFPQVFLPEPWLILAIWQGGFSPVGGAVGAGVVTALALHRGLPFVPAFGAAWVGVVLWFALTLDIGERPETAAPNLTLAMVSGSEFAFADAPSQPMVINLWATWCPPCRRELPMLANVAASQTDVTFLLASQGEALATVAAHLESAGISPDHMALDPAGALARHYGTIGLPVTLFLGADGMLAHVHVGEISRAVLLREITALTH
ncbi:TlpA disulfide reductase family protein [Roseinatronobacter monicus]|uniref:Thiol-disulfide isomerase/thioredoxin n=1 Tax=Roseinatronobacter monicus TaxID=393481 RepID=A0A543KFG8_9RHOB|nr:TlpA disulfide reductase family protein [Roseinatronobacter monicus]TQM93818.1 thiol-disulfide isomerase/thioredoxin [Roseinatronobacter monicus]